MLWALSPFHNELDILEIRLATLDAVVDRFVIAEAPVTQTGRPKPLHFLENLERFDPWLGKIEHVIVENMPMNSGEKGDWEREHFQRDALMRGVDLSPGDLVFSSDVDEIPYPDQLDLGNARQQRMILTQHVYALNWRWKGLPGARAMMLTAKDLSLQSLSEWSDWPELITGAPKGWHLSYMGGLEMIREKILAIADDFRKPEYAFAMDETHILNCIKTGADIYGRKNNVEWVGLEELPECASRFPHLLVPEPCAS